ncbi:MAG: hypothetical protein QM731_03300 [Chitinophagaceae bacterium]
MKLYLLLSVLLLVLYCVRTSAQKSTPVQDRIAGFPTSFLDRINKKASRLEDDIVNNTEKYLQRLAKQEKKLQKQLAKKDSAAAASLFGDVDDRYQQLQQSLQQPIGKVPHYQQYIPGLDSLKTSLNFLSANNDLLGNKGQDVRTTLNSLNDLTDKLQQAEVIKQYIRQRKQLLNEQLSKFSLTRQLKQYNQQAYYYAAQLQEYKNILNDPDKLQQKALGLLRRLPAWQSFFKQHSELTGLFSVPSNYGNAGSLAGLQTRADLQQLIQQRIVAGGPNAQQYIQNNMQQAQAQLNSLKDKLNKLGGNPDMDMPEQFKGNSQKQRSFLKRLEYGTNLQTQRSTYMFPTTSDVGLSVGYKLNDKSVIGIGGSYKLGWGNGWNNIKLTHQGVALRSFLDYKIKGSFFASGGFEYNYQPLSDSLYSSSPPAGGGGPVRAWTQSGLIGITKIVSLKSKLFKKTKLQLLWDFLSYRQVPRTQAIKFRVGYSF